MSTECLEFRRRVEAEPGNEAPDLAEHEARCASCARFRRTLGQFDGLIREALLVDVPAPQAPRRSPVAPERRTWWGIAAALVLAVGIGLAFRLPVPEPRAGSFAGHVVTHLEHEPEALDAVLRPMDRARVEDVLAAHGVRMAATTPIVYARTCIVDGKRVAHLVVHGASGAVTVMLLPGEQLSESGTFEAGSLSGRIRPITGGSVAIVGHDQPVEPAAERRILEAVGFDRRNRAGVAG
ncbi:MAG: DUF3379 family protein [Gammaproteobacteria bacterium]|nr:DUF3379 family protein [Gammaproteobacteria bacterium]